MKDPSAVPPPTYKDDRGVRRVAGGSNRKFTPPPSSVEATHGGVPETSSPIVGLTGKPAEVVDSAPEPEGASTDSVAPDAAPATPAAEA